MDLQEPVTSGDVSEISSDSGSDTSVESDCVDILSDGDESLLEFETGSTQKKERQSIENCAAGGVYGKEMSNSDDLQQKYVVNKEVLEDEEKLATHSFTIILLLCTCVYF